MGLLVFVFKLLLQFFVRTALCHDGGLPRLQSVNLSAALH